MPFYKPAESQQFRIATGGTGLQGLPDEREFVVETHAGSTAFLESQGVVGEAEVFRVSSGEQNIAIIPQGERVIVTYEVATVNQGLFEFEQEAVDVGRGVLESVDPIGLAVAEFVANLVLDPVNNEVVSLEELALREALRAAQALAEAIGPVLTDAPASESAPTADFGATGGTVSEIPVANPEGSTSQEAAPTGGCETIEIPIFDSQGQIIQFQLHHFDGSVWNGI